VSTIASDQQHLAATDRPIMLQRGVRRASKVRVSIRVSATRVRFSLFGANLWLIRDDWKLKWLAGAAVMLLVGSNCRQSCRPISGERQLTIESLGDRVALFA